LHVIGESRLPQSGFFCALASQYLCENFFHGSCEGKADE
jgi:hypothetical protein